LRPNVNLRAVSTTISLKTIKKTYTPIASPANGWDGNPVLA